jgi:hypothetical protein
MMTANIAYFWTPRTAPDLLNNLITDGIQLDAAIASSPDGTRYFAAWRTGDQVIDFSVQGRLVDSTGTPLADEFLVT